MPRFLAANGLNYLKEAQLHCEMEIYNLVSQISDAIDDYEQEVEKC